MKPMMKSPIPVGLIAPYPEMAELVKEMLCIKDA
jgi:hypothetical protein